MRQTLGILLACVIARPSLAQTPNLATTVMAVDEEEAKATDVLRHALASADPRVRSAAARVALVRGFSTLETDLVAAIDRETDANAAREQLRALALLANNIDIDGLIARAKKYPAGVDAALAHALARRGPDVAMELFKRRAELRVAPDWNSFFRAALWSAPGHLTPVAARVLGSADELAWLALLKVARQSNVAITPSVLSAAVQSPSEPIRVATFWYLAHGYAPDPLRFPETLKSQLSGESTETFSDREAFGRELVRRIATSSKREDPRWMDWLASKEADQLLENDMDLLVMLTDKEFTIRETRCKDLPLECAVPKKGERRIPSKPVLQPDFQLPTTLPAGIGDAVMSATRCRGSWLSVATATVDSSGRVQKLKLTPDDTSSCATAMRAIVRLSLADNERVTSPLTTDNLLLVRARGASICLDEDSPSLSAPETAVRAGGDVRPPTVEKRVEPQFPDSARYAMSPMGSVLVIVESTISKAGCVRNVRLLSQAPFPELNAAAIIAISQWRFRPGMLDGKPVDTIFNLTVNFKLR